MKGFRGIGVSVKGVEKEQVDDWIKTFETVLERDEVLQVILEESDYAAKLGVPEGEALAHLKEAIKVSFSKNHGTIVVGLIGKHKQNTQLNEISQRIFSNAAPLVAEIRPGFGVYYQKLSQGS